MFVILSTTLIHSLIYIATLVGLTVLYLICLIWLRWGLGRLNPGCFNEKPTVSVIVAARNEEKNISNCLTALKRQNYPKDKLEILIVDDRSEDATANLVRKAAESDGQVKLLQISEPNPNVAPKKWALATGIRCASGEIIMVTDADCLPGENWVQAMIVYFEDEVGLVAGFSPLVDGSKRSILQRLMMLDSLSLACVAAGSFGAAMPLTCNGRNLAYRKQVYEQVDGFSRIGHLISGDDDLFLHQVRQRTDWKVRYAIDSRTIVPTPPPPNLAAFLNQRIRHASKGKHYSAQLKGALILIYLLNCYIFFGLPIAIFISYKLFLAIIICLLIKASAEFFLLKAGATIFHKNNMLCIFPIGAVLHIPYVVIFGALGFWGKFKWKGETFQAKMS